MRHIVLLLLLISTGLAGQVDTSTLAIGQWRTLLPLRTGRYVTQSVDKVYYAAEESILAIDKVDFSLEEII